MRLLAVTPFLPYARAPHAVASTVLQWLQRVAERHEVDLISFVDSQDDARHQKDVREFCNAVTLVHRRVSKPALLYRLLRHPTRPKTEWAFRDRHMMREIREQTTRQHYDVVQVEYSQMAQYASWIGHETPRILVKHDVRAVMAWRAWKSARGVSRVPTLAEWLKMPSYELNTCQQFDAVVTLSEHNRRLLQAFLPDLPVHVIPPGVEIAPVKTASYDRPGRDIVFFGDMSSRRNVSAVLEFYRCVFPKVQQAEPDSRLHILGANPVPEVSALDDDRAVTITGYVPDTRAYFSLCDVAIAPMQEGGGILMKVLETMAAGLPVVATPIANEGIEAGPDSGIIVAADVDGFAGQIVHLLRTNDLRRRVGLAGQAFIERRFGWTACIDAWDTLYENTRRRTREPFKP